MNRNKAINSIFLISILALFIYSCESEPVVIDSSITDNNTFFISQFFPMNGESASTQYLDSSVGESQRLYSGLSDEISKTTLLKLDFDLLRESKYCLIDPNAGIADTIINELDSIRLVLRSFTKLLDDNEELLLDESALTIRAGFSTSPLPGLDTLIIFDSSVSELLASEDLSLISNQDELPRVINFDQYLIYIHLPFEEDWCDDNSADYIIRVDYNPDEGQELQYIEFTSSQYTPDTFRPSLDISYQERIESSAWLDIFSISSEQGVLLDGEVDDVYYVYNDTLTTKSSILLAKDMDANFNELFNSEEFSIQDIDFYNSSSLSANQLYELEIKININPEIILDSLTAIQFTLDNVVAIGNMSDPSGDNYDEINNTDGTESNFEFDQEDVDEVLISEPYEDLGFDRCPDKYEDGSGGCLCEDYINSIDECISLEASELKYNSTGKEGNGVLDSGENFSPSDDCGEDGCCDNQEDGEGGCLDSINEDYNEEDNPDPNNDNYNLDPSDDNWGDCGSDGKCNEFEAEYDPIDNPDPSGDDWSAENLSGTEGNSMWDSGERLENNGQWDYIDSNGDNVFDSDEPHERFNDWGTDGVPEADESNCIICIDDLDTESNNLYDMGEPFEDTGIDRNIDEDEEFHNSLGTENNNVRDVGENFSVSDDCGEDGCCNNKEDGTGECLDSINESYVDGDDPNGDDYNIDPNNDNWNDCGINGDCEVEDEGQGDQMWNNGENYENNGNYDFEGSNCACDSSVDCIGECFYDWGVDQLSDKLEIMSSDTLLSYSTPGIVSYEFIDMDNIENSLNEENNVLIDIISITSNSDNSISIRINITSDQDFRAVKFRLGHMPYYQTEEKISERTDYIYKLNDTMLFEDISLYENAFNLESLTEGALVVDYANSIGFKIRFNELDDFISQNPNIYIDNNRTKLLLNFNHADPLFNFFDGSVELIASQGDHVINLSGVIFASANPEVSAGGNRGVPFNAVIQSMIDGDIDPALDVTFKLNGYYNNLHRLVFDNQSNPPKLELMYSK